jgi:hypothetical protein
MRMPKPKKYTTLRHSLQLNAGLPSCPKKPPHLSVFQKLIASARHRFSPALPLGLTSDSNAVRQQSIHYLRIKTTLMLSCLLAALAPHSISAELPTLSGQPWLGYYAVHANKNYEFKVAAADGKVSLIPLGEGTPVLGNLLVYINFGIEETLPDGKIISSPMQGNTLETSDPASDKLSKSILHGKTAGNASVEITIEQSRGIVFVGSRVLEPGAHTHPIRTTATVVFPNINPPAKPPASDEALDERDAKRAAKKEVKDAEDKLKDDGVTVKWTDGKRHSITFEKPVNAGTTDFNGPGITAAEVKIATYGKKKFLFNASPNSVMKISNPKPASLSEGFSLQWSPNPEKNKEGKARLAIEVK